MTDFEFHDTINLAFGKDAIKRLPDFIKATGATSLLLISSGDYVDELGITDAVRAAADQLGVAFTQDKGVVPNPRLEHVRELIELGRERKVDLLIAAGGGSSIDTAKATGIGLKAPGDVWDYFPTTPTIAEHIPTLPVGVISTIPGTGSEVSQAAVITREDTLEKRGAESPSLRPAFTIVDPTYALSVPEHFQAAGIADISAHIIENYAGNDKDVDVTDRLLEAALQSNFVAAERFVGNPQDPAVRVELHRLSLYQHFLEFGRTADWSGHIIEHALSGLHDLLHGEGLAIITPAWLRYIAPRHPEKIVQLAQRVLVTGTFTLSGEATVNVLADYQEGLYRRLGLKTRLSEYGLGEKEIREIARVASADGTHPVGRYLPLSQSDVEELLRLAL